MNKFLIIFIISTVFKTLNSASPSPLFNLLSEQLLNSNKNFSILNSTVIKAINSSYANYTVFSNLSSTSNITFLKLTVNNSMIPIDRCIINIYTNMKKSNDSVFNSTIDLNTKKILIRDIGLITASLVNFNNIYKFIMTGFIRGYEASLNKNISISVGMVKNGLDRYKSKSYNSSYYLNDLNWKLAGYANDLNNSSMMWY
jgi:hypothetical protein